MLHLRTMWNIDPVHLLFLCGLGLIIITLLRQLSHRIRQSATKEQQRAAAVKAAQEAERKNMSQVSLPKMKTSQSKTRMPLPDYSGTPFTGAIQGQAAKWEVEIHQLGRQIIGQIETKMAALQAITLDANRTANRLEILVEHLEQIAQKQVEKQQEMRQNVDAPPTEAPPTVISATKSAPEAAAPLAEVLKELTDNISDFRNSVKKTATFSEFTEQVEQATILRIEDIQAQSLRGEVEMLTNYGLKPPEIARRLNVSVGEVDLILQVQQNQAR